MGTRSLIFHILLFFWFVDDGSNTRSFLFLKSAWSTSAMSCLSLSLSHGSLVWTMDSVSQEKKQQHLKQLKKKIDTLSRFSEHRSGSHLLPTRGIFSNFLIVHRAPPFLYFHLPRLAREAPPMFWKPKRAAFLSFHSLFSFSFFFSL